MDRLRKIICTILTMLLMLSSINFVFADTEIVITPSVTDGGIIPVVGEISFTFNIDMNPASFSTSTVLLKEKVNGTDTYNNRLYKFNYDTSKKVFTINFDEGDIAPSATYVIEFTQSIQAADDTTLTAPVFFTYVTSESGYYINDNFSRYPVDTWLGNKKTYTDVLPWSYMSGNGGKGSADIKKGTDNKTVLQLKSNKNAAGFDMNVAYRADYLPETSATIKLNNLAEIDFEISGGVDASYLLGGIFVIRRHETLNKFFLYYGIGKVDSALASRDTMTPLCEVATPTVGTMAAHSLKYLISTDMSSGISRKLREISFDGTKLTRIIDVINTETGEITYKDFPAEGIALSGRGDVNAEYYYQSSATYYRAFSIGRDSTLAYDTAEGTVGSSGTLRQEEALLKIYSFKYEPVKMVKKILTEGDPQFPTDGIIKIYFGLIPSDKDFSGDIVLKDSHDNEVLWTGIFNAEDNVLEITPSTVLNSNELYTVTVSGSIEYTINLDLNATDTVHNFTTDWRKLSTSSVPVIVSPGNFSPTFDIQNISLLEGTFTTRTVLYKKTAEQLHMLNYTDTSQNVALGTQYSITAGSVTVPNDGGNYYVKVFILENNIPIADPVVIGEAAKIPITAVDGTQSVISAVGNIDDARIDVTGKYVGTSNRAIWVNIYAPDDTLIYNDQTNNGTTGDFAFGFNILPGATSGTYTVSAKPIGGNELTDTVEMNFTLVKPTLSELKIEGEAVCGKTISADYTWFDFAGRQDDSLVRWYLSDSASGIFEVISVGKDFSLDDSYIGKYVKCTVLPKTIEGVEGTTIYETEALHIVSMPRVTNAVLSLSDDNQVTLSYDYSNLLGYEEYQSVYKWYIADTINGDYTQIDNNNALYRITSDNHGKYVKVGITPYAMLPEGSDAKKYGDVVTTEPIIMYYKVKESGGGSNFGGGFSVSAGITGSGNTIVEDKKESGTIDLLDVRGHWAEKEIFSLYDRYIVYGRGGNLFEPESPITRSEFIAILIRGLGFETVNYRGDFKDVKAEDWCADLLQTALDNGLFEGSGGCAYPNRQITREEMTTIVVRAYEKFVGEIIVGGGFLEFEDSADISSWARQAVGKAKEVKLVQGTGDGMFTPYASTNRAQAAVIISRLLVHTDKAMETKNAEVASETDTE